MTREKIETFKPRLKVMNPKQMWSIHAAALEILKNTGFEMKHTGAQEMLLDAGCSLSRDGRVRLPARLAETALKTAPKRIQLYNQKGEEAMDLVDENWFYGTGSDATFTIDVNTGQRRRTLLKDTGNFANLVDGLENIDFAMSMGNPSEVPVDDIYVYAFVEMIRNTTKPVIFIADSGVDIAKIFDIACLVAGGEQALKKGLSCSIIRKLSVRCASPKTLWKNLFSVQKRKSPYAFHLVATPVAVLR